MPEGNTRRRGEELENAILDAAWAELVEVGYAKLTIEAVALRAGTSKPVLYRRWPGRAELAIAAWRKHQPVSTEPPDTGSLRSDLIAFFTRMTSRFHDMPADLIAGVATETFRDPDVFRVLRKQLAMATTHPVLELVVRRAIERGEIAPVRLHPRVLSLPLDLIRADAILHGRHLSAATITEIVDEVFLPLLRGLTDR